MPVKAMTLKRGVVCAILSGLLVSGGGCQSNAGTGALIGGAAGAGIGAIAGKQSHGKTVNGALIGGAVGAIGGGLIGNEMDKKEARERERVYDRDRDSPPPPPPPRRAARYDAPVTREDVIDWTRRGDRDEQIIDRIDRSRSVFYLSSRDENQLRDAGVSEEVIRAMKDTARR